MSGYNNNGGRLINGTYGKYIENCAGLDSGTYSHYIENNNANTTVSPLTLITSVPVSHWWRTDLGITLNSGAVSSWADQVASTPLVQVSATRQPIYTAVDSSFNNLSTLTADGVDDALVAASINLTGNKYFISVVKIPVPPGNSQPIYGTPSGFIGDGNYLQTFAGGMYQSGPTFNANNGTLVPVTGSWMRVQDRRQNNTSDYIKLGNIAKYTGTACTLSVNPTGSWGIAGCIIAGVYLNCLYRELIVCDGEPTTAELTAIDNYITAQYSGVLI